MKKQNKKAKWWYILVQLLKLCFTLNVLYNKSLQIHTCSKHVWIRAQTITLFYLFIFPLPTSDSLSLSDTMLHIDWFDDSLVAELCITKEKQMTQLISDFAVSSHSALY